MLAMPTYEYETIPAKPGDPLRRFEVTQRMADRALTRDPETGLPVRRVVSGGLGPLLSEPASSGAPATGGGCGRGGCGHSHFH